MIKIVSFILATIMCLFCFASCNPSEHNDEGKHHTEHTYKYIAYEASHFKQYTCGCPSPEIAEGHFDNDGNNECDACNYRLIISNDVAKIVIDYEKSLRDEIENLENKHPENNYYYHPVDEVHCTYILDSEASADALVQKYDMNNVFATAKVSALNAIKMISVIFDRNDFTEDMHQKIKHISEEESLIESLFVDMERDLVESYMPKIEYYTDYEAVLNYEIAKNIIKTEDKGFIIKSKEEYDDYLDGLLENAIYPDLKETISGQRNVYDEAFFEENALIVTDTITRSSLSIKLTVNNLYISDNKVYVVVRTDAPGMGDTAMQFTHFTFIVSKSEIINVTEVITLE